MERRDARDWFFGPFYVTRSGQILALASPNGQLRDGLTVAELALRVPREYEGIRVEPCQPGLQLADSIVLVGRSQLFLNPDEVPAWGTTLGLDDAERKLGARLRTLEQRCCFEIRDDGAVRVLVNKVTGAAYVATGSAEGGFLVDYAVIRRYFRGPTENTVTVEGLHGLGTFGGAKLLTSANYLETIRRSVLELPGFDDSKPLEILVRVEYLGVLGPRVYSLETVKVVPMAIVFNRQWIRDVEDGGRWTDQMPWSLDAWMRGEEPPVVAPAPHVGPEWPRLEVDADLSDAPPALRSAGRDRIVRALSANGEAPHPRSAEDVEAALRALAPEVDRFHVTFFESETAAPLALPAGDSGIRKERKRFFVQLALRRLFRTRLVVDEPTIRELFPEFAAGKSSAELRPKFIVHVPGRMRKGFEEVMGPAGSNHGRLSIDCERRGAGYALRLNGASLVVRLRF
jgi:hypothetical protein